MTHVFFEFAGLLLISALAGAVAVRLRQPLIIAFIAVGILSGPAALGWVTAHNDRDARRLAQAGADKVLFPFDDAADFAAGVIEKETLKKETES